ncbi:hypothetical protein G6O69_36575 [Pseudenhygromyxa sp. WMMC2535]|uniref:hypothetical protein n=1 Tax=Pseudenhygromyxa sp. WMMC2535 TaxID=2712867 RepID=UPI001553A0C3|nr:hypothetical protein [Pseudenhygromyxa sp. WMMC2535]NVB36199.1 hypothetical protein [Pseudenhygromyxa sp. WMMC2535]NVB43398.1 hypothetical protein [Pseudenhygromyxa sp. WMMC2535]
MHSRRPRITRITVAGLLLAALCLLAPTRAWAIEYEIFIDVDDEEQLYELYISDQISEDTFNTLVELRRRGVDLNEATREELYSLPNLTYDEVDAILAYRAEAGVIHRPADLAAAGALSERKLAAILTFIVANDPRSRLTATHGWVRYQTAWTAGDTKVPPMALQARVTTLRHLTVGVAAFLTRQRPGNPVWDPTRDALMAEVARPRVAVPKAFAQWDTSRWGVIVGSYRAGFGQRLVFDTSDRYTPNGFYFDDAVYRDNDLGIACRESAGELAVSPCAGAARYSYETKDFKWRDGQRGLAIGAKHLDVPVGWLQLYGFGSWQRRQIYQYELYDADACSDPRSSEDACSAPAFLVLDEDQDALAPTSAHKSQTLPNVYDEVLGGANFTWFYDRRTHVGVTGYGASALWNVEGATLDFQDWSSTPFGGAWGAVGVDMAWGRRWSDLAVELARSFDSMQRVVGSDADYGGGGFAGVARHTSTFGKHELELSARYYDIDYANPYAGSIAQADEFNGNRARDEAGGRVRYIGRIADRLDLRSAVDFWVTPSRKIPKFLGYVRSDIDVNSWFRPGLWLQYRSSDLRPGKTEGCAASGGLFVVIDGEVVYRPSFDYDDPNYRSRCLAESGQITARLAFKPIKRLSITAQYQHEVLDDVTIDGRSRQDAAAYLIVRTNPWRSLRIVGRMRYLHEDINRTKYYDEPDSDDAPRDADRYEQSLWTYVDLSYVFKKVFLARLRYDNVLWLDNRTSTELRTPSPEHRLRLELEVRF